MTDEITEFEEIDPLEVHLVGTPASKFAALMAKSTEKGPKMDKKLSKKIRKEMQTYPSYSSPSVTGVNLAGAATTISRPGDPESVVQAVFAQLDDGVRKAEGDLAQAEQGGTELGKMRARSNLMTALRRRFTGKLIIAENVRGDGPASPFGTALFKAGSMYQLGDDPDVGYSYDNRRH